MKKIISAVIALVMALSCSATAITAAAENAVNLMAAGDDYVVEFPDPVLKEYMVLNFDTNRDGMVQKSEISNLDNVWIYLGGKVVDATGLEEIQIRDGGQLHIRSRNDSWTRDKLKNIDALLEKLQNNPDNAKYYLYFDNTGQGGYSDLDDSSFDCVDRSVNPNVIKNSLEHYELYIQIGNSRQWSEASKISNLDWVGPLGVTELQLNDGAYDKPFVGNPDYSMLKKLIVWDSASHSAPGVCSLVNSSPKLSQWWYADGEALEYLANPEALEDLMVWNCTNEQLAALVERGNSLPNLREIEFRYCDELSDVSPLQNTEVRHIECTSVDGYTNGKNNSDIIFEQICNNPNKLSYIRFDWGNLSDLTPLKNSAFILSAEKRNIDLLGTTASLAYKDNKAIYDEVHSLPNVSFSLDCCYNRWHSSNDYSAQDSLSFPNGTSLDIKTSVNRKSYINGEPLTYTANITNTGSSSADFDLFFSMNDKCWDKINILNGSRQVSVSNLAPGESVTKTISFSTTKDFNDFMCMSVSVHTGSAVDRIKALLLRSRSAVSLNGVNSVLAGDTISLFGTCAPDMAGVQIVDGNGDVLYTPDYKGGTSFKAEFPVPENYIPAVGEINTMKIKAVVTDKDGASYSSGEHSIYIRKMDTSSEDNLDVEDCHYTTYGSGHQYREMEPVIIYYGDRIIVRAKFAGVEQSDIRSAQAVINGVEYNMSPYLEGKYAGYYGVMSQSLISGDSLYIKLKVTTKSGEELERFVGYGKILIDPSGIITDPNGNPIEGVKVTLQKQQIDGSWANWDAENYAQSNPVYTNEKGYYGWDVVEGTYRIIAEKEGYVKKIVERYYSRDQGEETAITVLPPRMDVDFSMEYADPENPPAKTQTNDEAKAIVENALSTMRLNSAAVDTDVISEITPLLTDNMYLSFKNGTYVKSDDKITGTLVLENLWTDEKQTINAEIPLDDSVTPSTPKPSEPTPKPTEPTPTPSVPSQPIVVTESKLPGAECGVGYNVQLEGQGGTAPYTWEFIGGVRPEGLTINADGTIVGTPTKTGYYKSIKIRCTDASGKKKTKKYSLLVNPRNVHIELIGLPSFTYDGQPHKLTLKCTEVPDLELNVTYGADKKPEQTKAGMYRANISSGDMNYRIDNNKDYYLTIN